MVTSNEFIEKVYDSLLLPKTSLNNIDARLYLSDIYSMQLGLYNTPDTGPTNPLDSIGYYDQEDPVKSDLFDRRIREFIDLGIAKLYGINLLEYLELPTFVLDDLNKAADKAVTEKGKKLNDVIDQLESGGLDDQ